jgi:predicted kinase
MPTAHLLCGPAGAGKTTYALRLREEGRAVHLSIDDWMVTLFGPEAPVPPDWAWISDRIRRCEVQILSTALEVGRCGLDTILDLSFLRSDQRARVAGALRAGGVAPRLHLLDPGSEERWRRVSARNEAPGETYRVTVTKPMFDFIDALWQPPTPEEMATLDGVEVSSLMGKAAS